MPEPILIALSLTAIFLSAVALALSCAAIAAIVGFKNSTHTIEWKPLETAKVDDDPFAVPDEEEIANMDNPNKRKPKSFKIVNPHPTEAVKEEEFFADLDDPNETANNW